MPDGMEEEILTNHRSRLRELSIFQNTLTVLAMESFTRNNFELEWLKLSAFDRQKHLLEGMVRTCTMMPVMENHRIFCDEITLPFLERGEGRGYLGLLKHFMVKDSASVSKVPIYISSPRWDWMVKFTNGNDVSEKELAMRAYSEGVRNSFICKCQNHLNNVLGKINS